MGDINMRARDIPRSPVAEWIKFVSSMLLIPVVLAGFAWVVTVEHRLTKIEASRFTANDGVELLHRLHDKADKNEVPPPEVIVRLDALEREVGRLRELIEDEVLGNRGG